MIVPLFVKQIKSLSRHWKLRSLSTNTSELLRWKRFRDWEQKMPKSRSDPLIKKLDTPEFQSIFSPELDVLKSLFEKHNYDIRIAGGAVRDVLMGLHPKDLDFATTATPEEMKSLFNDEGIRMLNTRGEKHGTITARINDTANFEVTTLRIDVVTDGRHADIEFTTDWKLDANRRDLTINSMFLDFDGNVYDYFFGYDDLQAKKVVFVGDAATRICEDFLRILRYFRFCGRISEISNNHEEHTIKAIKDNVEGLERVSGERIWGEWYKILEGNFGMELTIKMIECNLGKYIGCGDNPNVENFEKICLRARSNNVNLHPITMISAMLNDVKAVMDMFARLRWSAFERDLALFIVTRRDDELDVGPNPLYSYQHLLLTSKVKDIREYICQVLFYRGQIELAKQFTKWVSPKFPVTGHDLKNQVTPRLIARTIHALKGIWLQDDCKTNAAQLLERVPEIVIDLNEKYKPILNKCKTKKK